MRTSGVGAPITTAINLLLPRFAELARQYPAALVKPVLIPSTLSSMNRSLFLEYCFISLNLKDLVEYNLYKSGKFDINERESKAISSAVVYKLSLGRPVAFV